MNQENITTVQISKDTRKKLKIIAAVSGKRLYELIDEAIPFLKENNNVRDM